MDKQIKKFKDVKVGENLFYILIGKSFLESKDQYGNIYNNGVVDGETKVTAIATDKNGNYVINPKYEYGDIKSGLITLNPDQLKNDIQVEVKYNHYEQTVYFADENICKDLLREHILKFIAKVEKEAKEYIIQSQNNIEQVRKRYFTVLNPKLCTTLV